MVEVGYKQLAESFSLFATAFFTDFENIRFENTTVDPLTGSFVTQVQFADTETFGLEFEGSWTPVEFFELSVTFTWQDAQFQDFAFDEEIGGVLTPVNFTGNQPVRIPEFATLVRPTLVFGDGDIRVYSEVQFYSKRFGDNANTVELDDYFAINAGATYFINDSMEITVSGHNLTDEIGLTEGNPRAGQFTSADVGAVFLARPIFGTSVRVSFAYRF